MPIQIAATLNSLLLVVACGGALALPGVSAAQSPPPSSRPELTPASSSVLQRAQTRAKQSWLARRSSVAVQAACSTAQRTTGYTRGLGTLAADRLEQKLPAPAGKVVQLSRRLNPAPAFPFLLHKFGREPAMWGYQFGSCLAGKALAAGLMAGGFDPVSAAVAPLIIGIPRDMGVMFWWEHRKDEAPDRSLSKTVSRLRQEYVDFVQARRQENRARVGQP